MRRERGEADAQDDNQRINREDGKLRRSCSKLVKISQQPPRIPREVRMKATRENEEELGSAGAASEKEKDLDIWVDLEKYPSTKSSLRTLESIQEAPIRVRKTRANTARSAT